MLSLLSYASYQHLRNAREAQPDILTLPDLDVITLASYLLSITPEWTKEAR